MKTVESELIRGKIVTLDELSFNYGGSWGPDGTNDPVFLDKCLQIIENKNYKNVLDIGANTGQFIFFQLFKSDVNLICFEPLPKVYEVLKNNILLNNLNKVKSFNIALSNKNGNAIIYRPSDMIACGMSTMGEKSLRFKETFGVTEEEIYCKTLDSFVNEEEISMIDFIKIDTEGFEYFILLGGMETIKKFKPDLVIEYQKINMEQCNVNEIDLKNLLIELGYNKFEFLSEEDLYCTYE
jgi:FkbM family methyltransferase